MSSPPNSYPQPDEELSIADFLEPTLETRKAFSALANQLPSATEITSIAISEVDITFEDSAVNASIRLDTQIDTGSQLEYPHSLFLIAWRHMQDPGNPLMLSSLPDDVRENLSPEEAHSYTVDANQLRVMLENDGSAQAAWALRVLTVAGEAERDRTLAVINQLLKESPDKSEYVQWQQGRFDFWNGASVHIQTNMTYGGHNPVPVLEGRDYAHISIGTQDGKSYMYKRHPDGTEEIIYIASIKELYVNHPGDGASNDAWKAWTEESDRLQEAQKRASDAGVDKITEGKLRTMRKLLEEALASGVMVLS